MGLSILKTLFRAPQANAFCERLVGTIRRECLNFLIPLTERHLRGILREWVAHYNRGRPHSSLGPGFLNPQEASRCHPFQATVFRVVTAWSEFPSWAVSITNTGLRR